MSTGCSVVKWTCLAVVLAAIGSLQRVEAQDERAAKAMDQFGQLPLRFNGRISNYDTLARNLLRRFSGRDHWYDQQGQQQPAIGWLLDVMTQHNQPELRRVFRVHQPELLKTLNLEPHEGPETTRFHYSLSELQPSLEALQSAYETVVSKQGWSFEGYDHAVIELFDQLSFYFFFDVSCQMPEVDDRESAQQMIQQIQILEQNRLPMLVPRADFGEWRLLVRESVLDSLVGNDPEQQNSLYRGLKLVFDAHRAEDMAAFVDAVSAYRESLEEEEMTKSPFDFTTPADWTEIGVPVAQQLVFYQDADAMGHRIAEFLWLQDDRYSEIVINHFVGQDVALERLDNTWRIMQALAPLPDQALRQRWKPVQVGNRDGIWVESIAPDDVDFEGPQHMVSVVVQDADHTWVIGWSGDRDVIDKYRTAFETFVASIKMGPADELADWFHADGHAEPLGPTRLLAAMVPDDNRLWVLVISSSPELVEVHRQAFVDFVQTVRPLTNEMGKRQLEWQPPESWQRVGDYGQLTFVLGTDQQQVPMTVIPLAEVHDDSLLALVNHWRGKLRLAPLAADQLGTVTQSITVHGQPATLVDLTTTNN